MKRKLKELLKFEYRDVIQKNLFLLFLFALLYFDFDDACYEDYSSQIEQCLQILAIFI